MSVELKSDIALADMKDGQLAQITRWLDDAHVGKIVQRFENRLICIGKYSGWAWTGIFTPPIPIDCRVRLLQPGEKITVTNNRKEGTR
jgi:predicted pyridoxine 5'-phosphate oxidase superfamily flavin-nucleotide-binding protein